MPFEGANTPSTPSQQPGDSFLADFRRALHQLHIIAITPKGTTPPNIPFLSHVLTLGRVVWGIRIHARCVPIPTSRRQCQREVPFR
jgi:hypothetical protein